MKLDEWLTRAGVYTSDFAERVGVSRKYILLLRSGKRTPSLALAGVIAQATGGSVTMTDWLCAPSRRRAKRTPPDDATGSKNSSGEPVKNARRNLTDTTKKCAEMHGSDGSA